MCNKTWIYKSHIKTQGSFSANNQWGFSLIHCDSLYTEKEWDKLQLSTRELQIKSSCQSHRNHFHLITVFLCSSCWNKYYGEFTVRAVIPSFTFQPEGRTPFFPSQAVVQTASFQVRVLAVVPAAGGATAEVSHSRLQVAAGWEVIGVMTFEVGVWS